MRYTFSGVDLHKCISDNCYIVGTNYFYFKDPSYEKYFKKVGLEEVYNELKYTHTIITYELGKVEKN